MKPIVLSAPHPRTLELIFEPDQLDQFMQCYHVIETTDDELEHLPDDTLGQARYILGQPPLSPQTLERLASLRAVLNVESNLLDNMPYPRLFERGIHVLTTGAVFAMPVAELGLALALDLARGVTDGDIAFRQGCEQWGGEGNDTARLLTGSQVGILGYGDLGRALRGVLRGFNCTIKVHDPWLPPSLLVAENVIPSTLEDVVTTSDFLFVVAAVTSENRHFFDADLFSQMQRGARFILLSRADVVDFEAMIDAVKTGHITAASDVFPQEPVPADHPVRQLDGFIRSAHRGGALDAAFKQMGEMVLQDMALMDRGLPPRLCKRAERETASRMQSRPVTTN